MSIAEPRKRPDPINPDDPIADIDSEKAIIGTVLRNCEKLTEIQKYVTYDDFRDEWCRKLFGAMCQFAAKRKKIDATLMRATCVSLKIDPQFLFDCLDHAPVTSHGEYYAANVRKASLLRQVVNLGSEASHAAIFERQEPEEILGRLDSEVGKLISKCANGTAEGMDSIMTAALGEIEKRMAGDVRRGVATGYTKLDDIVGSLMPGKLIVIAGRPSMGKSAFATNACEHVAAGGDQVLYVSLEMTKVELAERILSSQARVDTKDMRNGTLTAEQRQRIVQSASLVSQWPLCVLDEPHMSIRQIAAHAAQHKRKHGLALVVIDYLQLVEPADHRVPRQEQVAQMTRQLKVMARELEVPIIVVAQLNRQTESATDNRPRLSHLRESGAIEQDADMVWFVHREEYYIGDETKKDAVRGKAELIVSKNRGGPTGTANLTWQGRFTRFDNAASVEFYGHPPERNGAIENWNEGDF